MLKKPVALILRSAGFLVLAGWITQATMACVIEDGKSTVSGLTQSPGDINEEVLAACHAYCEYIYSSATGCDPGLIEVQEPGCRSFCNIQAQSIPDQCEELFFEHYSCVIAEALAYVCADEDASPQPIEDICEAAADQAKDCLAVSTQ
jgi:hypothetical protein